MNNLINFQFYGYLKSILHRSLKSFEVVSVLAASTLVLTGCGGGGEDVSSTIPNNTSSSFGSVAVSSAFSIGQSSSAFSSASLGVSTSSSSSSFEDFSSSQSVSSEPVPERFTADVNSSLQELEVTLPQGEQTAVIAFVDENGALQKTHFVKNQMIIAPKNADELQQFMQRWNVTIIKTLEFGKYGARDIYLVEVDSSYGTTAPLQENLDKIGTQLDSHISISSHDGLDLFAASIDESIRYDFNVSLNFIMQSSIDPTVSDAINEAKRDYFNWPYMNNGSTQEIGVVEAWNMLAAAGRLNQTVGVMVIDGGFQYDSVSSMYPDRPHMIGAWDRASKIPTSSGHIAPWHGTHVTAAGFGKLYANYATDIVGPGGPVARLTTVDRESLDVIDVMELILVVFDAPFVDRPKILNMSFGAEIPAPVSWFTDGILNLVGALLKGSDVLVVTSAGNENYNVDKKGPLKLVEVGTTIPCEMSGVLCVGGMSFDSTTKASYSNYGRHTGEGTVDIYGPYTVYGYDLNSDGSLAGSEPKLINGTSFASPFVAGVASLVWAADHNQSVHDVEHCLLSQAHDADDVTPGESGYQRRVNARDAVKCALEESGVTFPLVRILSPETGTSFGTASVSVKVMAVNEDGHRIDTVSFASDKDGPLSNLHNDHDNSYTLLGLTGGTHQITVSADGASDTISITVSNEAPSVRMFKPLNHHVYYVDEWVETIAEAIDRTNVLDGSEVTWTVDGQSMGPSVYKERNKPIYGTIFRHDIQGVRYFAVYAHDGEFTAQDNASPLVLPVPTENTRPVVNIDEPHYSEPYKIRQVTYTPDDTIRFSGRAEDEEDGVISGEHMVWTATNIQTGVTRALCSGGEGRDCGDFTADIRDEGDYDITLEVIDSGGVRRQDHIYIEIFELI